MPIAQMSFGHCVFYYWSDEEWDSCDKFREVATPILNPNEAPDLLEWRASDTQVFIKGRQHTTHRLINILRRDVYGACPTPTCCRTPVWWHELGTAAHLVAFVWQPLDTAKHGGICLSYF